MYAEGREWGMELTMSSPAITSAAAASAYPRAWAIVTAAIGLGLAFYLVAVLAERVAMPWQRPQGELS